MTTLYEKFKASIGRDGPDYSIVESARGEARDQLEDDLIANLGYYEAYALATLKSVKAVPKLKQQLPISSGYTKIAIARALWGIEQYPESLAVIASVLMGDAKSTSEFERIEAAWACRDIHQPEAITALANALFDEEYSVRSNAAQALAVNRGRRVSESVMAAVLDGDKEKIAKLAARLLSDRRTPRAKRSRSTPPRTGR